tara:strand:+ start:23 stop:601 length:579 start_codon:yes stop_codon:yes gene_type:complete
MAITINGNGTLTGVSVGGLPDGIVDTDMLAANAVTAPKRGAGAVLQTVNATATSAVSVSTNTLTDTGLTADITLIASNSHVLILVTQQFQTHQYNNIGDSDCAILIRRVTSGTTTGVFNPNANVKSIRTSGPGSGSYFIRTGTLVGMSVRDTPGAGTHTYKTSMQHNVRSGTASSANNDSHPAEIVLMEIAA